MAIDFDAELTTLQTKIRLLKREYDLYFSGNSKFPPREKRREVEEIIKRFRNMDLRKTSITFRLNGIMTQFAINREQWDKLDGYRERGMEDPRNPNARMAFDRKWSAMEREAREGKKADSSESKPKSRKTSQKAPSGQNELFKNFREARLATGMGAKMNAEQFDVYIEKQKNAVKAKYNCDDVQFKVSVVDGKVKLKAKPIRRKS